MTTDEDGWSTLETKKSEDEEGAIAVDGEKPFIATATSASSIAQETMKVKPNNKNISSSRPADTKDIVADKQIHGFNTFAALESDDDE